MAHVVSALIVKRVTLSNDIGRLQQELRQAVADLDNIEATLRLFAPEETIPALRPAEPLSAPPSARGETARLVLGTLRDASRPLTTNELTEAVMQGRGLDLKNPSLFRLMSKRVGACLRNWKKDHGTIRSFAGPGQQHLWQLTT